MAPRNKFQANLQRSGWKKRAHVEQDKVRVKTPYSDKALQNQKTMLERYVNYCHEDSVETLETIRARCLAKDVAAPDIETVKDFFRYSIKGSSGRIDPKERLTLDSAKTHAEWFFAGFKRVTERGIDEEDREEVYKWMKEQLARKEGLLAEKWKPKYNFSKDDLDKVLMTLWALDDTIFISERHRVQATLLFHIFCYTGARIGAFFPDNGAKTGLLWRDLTLVLQRTKGTEWRLIYRLDQRWVKNNRSPDTFVFGTAGKQHAQLIYDDASLLLALAIADGVLKKVSSVSDLQEQKLRGKAELPLDYKKGMELQPVVKTYTMANGVKSSAMSESSFSRILINCCKRAGYFEIPTVHSIRRSLGKKIDERYTESVRAQVLTQSDVKIFGRDYVASVAAVDGAAAFLDEPADHEPVNYFQSFRQFNEVGLPSSLPLSRREELHSHEDILRINERIADLTCRGDNHAEIKQLRESKQTKLKTLERKAFESFRKEWVQNRRDWYFDTRGQSDPQNLPQMQKFRILCKLIPQREKLSQLISSKTLLSRDQWFESLQSLLALCKLDMTVMYRPGEQPSEGKCPAKDCTADVNKIAKRLRGSHIHRCLQHEFARQHHRLIKDVYYCYECFKWLAQDQWEHHCLQHLDNLQSLMCGSWTFCSTLMRPAYCPFCLSSHLLLPSQRFFAWRRDSELWDHLQEKHLRDLMWPALCPHPMCKQSIADVDDLRYHLHDWHGVDSPESSRLPTQSSASRLLDQSENVGMKQLPNGTTEIQWQLDRPASRPCILGLQESSSPKLPIVKQIDIVEASVSIDGHLTSPRLQSPRQRKRKYSGGDSTLASPFDQDIETSEVYPSTISPSLSASTTSSSIHKTATLGCSSMGHYSDADDSPAPSKHTDFTSCTPPSYEDIFSEFIRSPSPPSSFAVSPHAILSVENMRSPCNLAQTTAPCESQVTARQREESLYPTPQRRVRLRLNPPRVETSQSRPKLTLRLTRPGRRPRSARK